jgi:hypothetical protein
MTAGQRAPSLRALGERLCSPTPTTGDSFPESSSRREGPGGYQHPSITIGTGGSDNLEISGASYLPNFGYVQVARPNINIGRTQLWPFAVAWQVS